MKMKDYQERAIAELISRAKNLLRATGRKVMVFKSPTGSGKTLMIAEFLARLTRQTIRPLSFIWAAPHDLHKQSCNKLVRYYADSRALRCSYFAKLSGQKIGRNEILFFNWESVREDDNIIVRENEDEFYLSKILDNTRAAKRDIVLIVDESHYHAATEIARDLVRDIAPKLVLEISATPVMHNPDDTFTVFLDEVKAEGMIKKSVVINEGFKNLQSESNIQSAFAEKADAFVLRKALEKRRQLAETFKAAKIAVNPLLCIQLPDDRIEQDANVRRTALETLAKKGITVGNGKLAIWLSEEKKNLDGISDNNNPAEVLIFKQAIALGWDCPRAHILVLFRQWQSIVFSVQTLGRIMRMPQPEAGYYKNEILNVGYVYTNLPEMDINEDIAGGYVHIHTAHRIDDYDLLALPSVHRLRQREQTRLSPRFIALFLDAAKEYGLAKKINRKNQRVQLQFITDYEATGVDAMTGEKIPGGVSVDVENEEDLQKLFDFFARENLSPFHPEDRSINRVKEAIYEFFGGPLEMGVVDHFSEIIKITLSDSNREHFVNVLTDTKDAYKAETENRKEPLEPTPKWEIAPKATYSENYRERKAAKSAMQPFFAANSESEPEKEFIKFLEKSKKVKWWHKNGEGDSLYFAVPYSKKGEEHPFYVDFIVRFTDGRVGLYDTKKGRTIDDAKEKSDGLLAYVKKHGQKGQIVGGIVAPANPNYKQGWKIYLGKGKDLDGDNLSNWKPLEF